MSLQVGWVEQKAKHRKGCSRPPGRIDIMSKLRPAEREAYRDGALTRPMHTWQVIAAWHDIFGAE